MTGPRAGTAAPRDEAVSGGGSPAWWALATGAALVGAVLVLAFLWYTGRVLLLAFAAVLLGVCLRGAANAVARWARLSPGAALAAVLVVLLALLVAGGWFLGTAVADQSAQLADTLPRAVAELRHRIEVQPWGERLLAITTGADGSGARMARAARGILGGSLGGALDAVLVVVLAVYLAAAPRLYVDGALALLPPRHHARAGQVLRDVAHVQRRWMAGRLTVMLINGILSWLGLWALGVPLPFLLGMLTGLLNFIPNLGPFLAAVPPLVLALAQGPDRALYVAILYVVIQNLEGFVLTPLVQQCSVSLPAALVLLGQILMGVLAGAPGVLFATPLAATLLVIVQMLYVRGALGEPVKLAGRDGGGAPAHPPRG